MPIKARKMKRRKTNSVELTTIQRAYLLTGIEYEFLGDTPAFPDEEAASAAWEANRESLMAECRNEHTETCKPWAFWQFDTDEAEPGHDPSRHIWHSEYARRAKAHPRYHEAMEHSSVDKWWVRTYSDVEAILDGCWFDVEAAERAAQFFRLFRHIRGEWAGCPMELLPWQRFDVVMPLFGWKRPDGTRRFRKALIEIPKKNGKSTMCSVVSLYLTIADREPGAEVYNAASDKKQAGIVFGEAADIAENNQYVGHLLKFRRSEKHLGVPGTFSLYEALSADVPTKEGIKTHGLIFDELHAQDSRKMWDTLVYGGASRRQPLTIVITTAGEFDPNGIGWEQHELGRKTLEGADGTHWGYFAYIRCIPEDSSKPETLEYWKDPAWWRRSNPSYGTTIKIDMFQEEANESILMASKQNSFRRYRCNIWVRAESALFNIADWDARREGPDLYEEMKGRKCWGGLDLASRNDLCAFTLWFPPAKDDGDHVILTWFWLPGDNLLELENHHQAPYSQWARDGYLLTTPGNVTDYQFIRKTINGLRKKYKIKEIGFDPWNAQSLSNDLMDDGAKMIEIAQSAKSMGAATKEFENIIVKHKMRHPGNPCMGWMIGNCMAVFDSNERMKITKGDKKIRYKVDGPVSAVIANCRVIDRPDRKKFKKGFSLATTETIKA